MTKTKRKTTTEHTMHASAEHMLRVGLRRAETLIRDGRTEDAARVLAVATWSADMIEHEHDRT